MVENKIILGANRSFGILFFIVFLIIGIYPLINDNPIRLWSLLVSTVFLILGLSNSRILTPFNIIWIKLGTYLGIIISPIVMGFVFFLVVTPISLIMKLLRKDILKLKVDKKKSYWLEKEKIKSSMKNQF
jgi:large-conductance mechanosensitive channel